MMVICPQCQAQVAGDVPQCPQCGAPLASDATTAPENSDDVLRDLLDRGEKIQAIKLFRERTGAGLAEAKAAVEALQQQLAHPVNEEEEDDLERVVLDLMAANQKIEAIKVVRQRTKCGLKEAKDFVEALAAWHGVGQPAKAGCLTMIAVIVLAAMGVEICF